MSKFTLGDWLALLASMFLVISTYAYVFGKKLFSIKFWKYASWIVIIFFIIGAIVEFVNIPLLNFMRTGTEVSATDGLIGLFFTLPALYGLYQVGRNKFAK